MTLMKPSRWATIAACVLLCTTATTAEVSSQARNGYQRLNFMFEKPTRLTVENGTDRIVLRFSTPLKKSPAEIAAMTGGYASKATLSADGKTLTLITAQRFRTRHFVSGNMVGLDIIGGENAPIVTAKVEKEKPVEELLTTKKQNPKPIDKKAEKPKKETEKKLKKSEAKPAKKAELAPKPAEEKKPEPVTEPATEEMLTTKETAPASKEVVEAPAPKTVEPAPATAQEEPVVTETPPPAASATAEETPPPTTVETVEEAAPAGPFKVTSTVTATGVVIHFPYTTRTAAAVFEHGNDIWLVFSQAADASSAELKKALPKNISAVTQYRYAGHTVLRLASNGSMHANIKAQKKGFGWDISLLPEIQTPAQDIPLSVDTVDEKSRILLGAFDVAEPIKFYDPVTGSLLLVVPSYEAGLGTANPRNFPEFSLLLSTQGIAVASAREDMSARPTRLGVALETTKGLAVSKNLSVLGSNGAPVAGSSSGVMLPYALWHVPVDKFKETLLLRQKALSESTQETRAENLLSLATLYLGEGMGAEAIGYLDLINLNEPEFYKTRKLALLSAAAHALQHHIEDAAAALAAPELADVAEAALWRDYVAMLAPKAGALEMIQQATEKPPEGASAKPQAAPPPTDQSADTETGTAEAEPEGSPSANAQPMMRFLKFNTPYIRFYPPRIRHMLARAAADAYITNGLEHKAITTFDTLTRDNILEPLQYRAEYAVALEAIKNKNITHALELLERIEKQNEDLEMKARARVAHAMLLMNIGKKTPEETVEALEFARMSWRGDGLERDVLKALTGIYKDLKRHDEALRSYKALVDEFPEDPDFLSNSTAMSELFEQLYVNGLADEMPPLKSLSLFYEFRDLTPIGEKGDLIIQKLADRLAAFDLLDLATQLLENQLNFRLGGEERSRVGAKLSLLYLLNHQPQEALKVIEVSNFGGNPPELQRQRLQLAAQALSGLQRHEEALNILYNDASPDGELLKLDIVWAMQDWPNVTNRAEDILSKRPDLTAPLTPTETEVLLKLALGYSFAGDYTQLRYLKDYYSSLVPDSAYKQIFEYVSNDTAPLDREDTTLISQQITRTEGFLSLFKDKIAAGKLSETIK